LANIHIHNTPNIIVR